MEVAVIVEHDRFRVVSDPLLLLRALESSAAAVKLPSEVGRLGKG